MNHEDPNLEAGAAKAGADCARAEELLAEYWQASLPPADRGWLEHHMSACADCAELTATWQGLGTLPELQSDPLQRQRFERMLEAFSHGQALGGGRVAPIAQARRWRPSFAHRWSNLQPAFAGRPLSALAALLCLAVGLGAGWLLRGGNAPGPSSNAQNQQIAELRDEIHSTRTLAVLSLLQEESANDRLQGVSYVTRMQQPDPQVLSALVRSLDFDSNPDVRLAALDALQHTATQPAQPEVRRQLVDAFQYQKLPMVQVAMVDSFVELRDPAARPLLQQVANDPNYDAQVRQRAAWGLTQWQ